MGFDLDPVLASALAVKIHLATVIPAFIIGTYLIFFSTKGAPHHRALGYLYLTLMTITAIAAIFIDEVNPGGFSIIHIFVPITLLGVAGAIHGARTHNVRQHRASMLGVYIGGILIAGSLTFLPGRIMHQVFFPQ